MATAAFSIPISKAGKNIGITAEEYESLPQEVFKAILAEGFKVYLNKGMSKITGMKDMDEEELAEAQEAAYVIAQKNKEALLKGELKARRTAAGAKTSREETTFVQNWFKARIKAAHKAAGKKLPAKASVLTQTAKDMIADTDNAELVAEARKEYAAMKAATKPIEVGPMGGALKALLDTAEDVKPRVPPTKKKKAVEGETAPTGVVVAAAKGKGKAPKAGAEARH